MKINVKEIAKYMLKNKVSIRKAAEVFNVDKSTLHRQLHLELPKNPILYYRLCKMFKKNYESRLERCNKAKERKKNEASKTN